MAPVVLLFAAGCGNPMGPVLQAGASCDGQPREAVASFPDPALQAAVMSAAAAPTAQDLTCGRLAQVAELDAAGAGVTSLVGIQNLPSLVLLDLSENPVGDIRRLSSLRGLRVLLARATGITSLEGIEGLTDLTFLDAAENVIVDLGPLTGLTGLSFVDLRENAITGIGPLAGLDLLRFLYLSANSISDLGPLANLTSVTTLQLGENAVTSLAPLGGIVALSSPRGATVDSGCP